MEKMKFFLHDIVSRLLRFIFRDRIINKKIEGINMRLYYEKSQHLIFLRNKTIRYDKKIQKKILEILNEGDMIFDLGANIGQYALFFSNAVGDSGNVVSVEPEINNYAFLQFNSNINRCSNIFCLNIGIGKEKGERMLYSDSLTGGRKSSFFVEETGGNYRGKRRLVPVLTYDDLVREFGSPQFVKIDVEGAEVVILEGIIDIPEDTSFLIEVRGSSKEFVFNYFSEKGFDCYCAEMENFNLLENIDQINGGVINLLFIPKGKVK